MNRILVAEDDVEMRRLVIEALLKDGHQVVDVTDGGELLIRITSYYRLHPTPEPIDLIVTDVRMPVVNGLEIVRALREARWKTPIVIMTAFGDSEMRAHAEKLGAVVIDKPFKMDVLRSIVRSLLVLEKR